MKKIIYSISAFIFCILFSSYITAQQFASSKINTPLSSKKIIIKYGLASFYAKKFHGRQTSDGSHYDSGKLTAACNQLPLGMWVKVTNISNDRTVVLHISDHLHKNNPRLIDVSKYAAHKLRFVRKGITRVRVEVLGR